MARCSSLPGGEIRAAIGYQNYTMLWWSNNKAGPLTAPAVPVPQHVTRTHDSYYHAEMNVPVISGEANAAAGHRGPPDAERRRPRSTATMTSATPRTRSSASNGQFPLDGFVKPTPATAPRSVQAQNILDLYQSSQNINAQSLSRSDLRLLTVAALALSGCNPGIKPEQAKTYSLGFDWNPTFLPNLQVSVNYFDLKLQHQIAAFLTDSTILSKEALLLPAPASSRG